MSNSGKTLRLVTSTYNDEKKMKWLTNLVNQNIPYIVYKKNDKLTETIVREQYNPTLGYQCLEIPNYGRCEYAFFHHIITNYDDLDDNVSFDDWSAFDNDRSQDIIEVYDEDGGLIATYTEAEYAALQSTHR